MTATPVFEKATRFVTRPSPDTILAVGVSGYGIVTRDSTGIDFVCTMHTADCTGLALLSDNGSAAIAHVFSNESFLKYGREKLERHAATLWQEFSGQLPQQEKFRAVAFGAQRSGIALEDAEKWPMDLVRRAAVSECLSEAFMGAALSSGCIEQLDDYRYMDSPHDAIIDRAKEDIIVGRMRDGLREKIPALDRMRPAENFRCGYTILPG